MLFSRRRLRRLLVTAASVALGACGGDDAHLQTIRRIPEGALMRDRAVWPYAADSLWNTGIGAAAVYHPISIAGGGLWINIAHVVVAGPSDPVRDVRAPGPRPEDPCPPAADKLGMVTLPDSWVLPKALNETWANDTAILGPDGRTVTDISIAARCQAGGALFGLPAGTGDVEGPGVAGGTSSSGVAVMGGLVRKGELTGTAPLRHVLKMGLWGRQYLFYDPAAPERCFRWPASHCDAYASQGPGKGYEGSDPELVMGALLAIPRELTSFQLQIKTAAGEILLRALIDYGAYVGVSAASDTPVLAMERAAVDEFSRVYGYAPGEAGAGQDFLDDVARLVGALQVVSNNGPASVGGGGARRQPPPPPFAP